MSAKRCPTCRTAGGWDVPDGECLGYILHASEFPCGTRVETVGDFGIAKTVTLESETCLRRQRDRLAKQVADLRKLVEDAYREGADDMSRDNADFRRSTSQATLEDIDNQ